MTYLHLFVRNPYGSTYLNNTFMIYSHLSGWQLYHPHKVKVSRTVWVVNGQHAQTDIIRRAEKDKKVRNTEN